SCAYRSDCDDRVGRTGLRRAQLHRCDGRRRPGKGSRRARPTRTPVLLRAGGGRVACGTAGCGISTVRILIAGIGNVYLGDDGFGVVVAERLRLRTLPEEVEVVDFGIRGIDLAYALQDCDAAVLVDTVRRGGEPGTLFVLEPELPVAEAAPELHAMTPD